MCRKICVTNRKLVKGDFPEQIKRALEKKTYAIILREKDLTPEEYRLLAKDYPGYVKLTTFGESESS